MEHEAVAVRGEDEGNAQGLGIIEALLHAVADTVRVVLGLDQRDRNVRLIGEDEVGPFALAAMGHLAANEDLAVREGIFLANLQDVVPSCRLQGGKDELRADVPLGEAPFVHGSRFAGSCWSGDLLRPY